MPATHLPKRRRNQWSRDLTPTQFIEKHYPRKAQAFDFETSYAKKPRGALRDVTFDSRIGAVDSKRLKRTETMTLHVHPTFAVKPSALEALIRQVGLNLSKEAKNGEFAPRKGTVGWKFLDTEKERKRTDFQRPLPSAHDLANFFLRKRVRTSALIITDTLDPTKVAGYVFMRKLSFPPAQMDGGIRVELIRRSLFLARAHDLESKDPQIRERAKKELVNYYPSLFRVQLKRLEKKDINEEFMKGVIKDLAKLGIKTRMAPNKKDGYAYIGGQFVRRRQK